MTTTGESCGDIREWPVLESINRETLAELFAALRIGELGAKP